MWWSSRLTLARSVHGGRHDRRRTRQDRQHGHRPHFDSLQYIHSAGGDLYYGRLPIEAIAFADAGFLWTRHASGPLERDRFRSVGAGARVNLGGIVFEMTAVRPFDRPRARWAANLLIRPGF